MELLSDAAKHCCLFVGVGCVLLSLQYPSVFIHLSVFLVAALRLFDISRLILWSRSYISSSGCPSLSAKGYFTYELLCFYVLKIASGLCQRYRSISPKASKQIQEEPLLRHIQLKDDANIHIGNKQIHSSHNMYTYRGLLYCLKCGATGTNQLRYLSKPCEPPSFTG